MATMIKLKQPSLVLHSHDVPGHRYKMHVSWNLPKGASVRDVVHLILEGYDYSPDLENVVINSHGSRGRIWAGGLYRPAINRYNVDVFGELRGKNIGTIWIVACEVAKGPTGSEFCRRMARAAGCHVVASDVEQYVERGFLGANGTIDFYEGLVYQWDSSGQMATARFDGSDIPGAF
jgi:hypothetical protein